MLYSSPEFIFFLAVVFSLFYFIENYTWRFYWLLSASFFFYAWAGLLDTIIFIFVILLSWACVYFSSRRPQYKKILIATGVIVMTAHLFFWKYANWFVAQVQIFHPTFLGGGQTAIPLPVGISFFTLQGIAYLVDYSKANATLMSFREYLLFKSFFPQLVAGPIVRSRELTPQIRRLASPSNEDITAGLLLFCLGFFKKMVLADRCAPYVDQVFSDPAQYSRGSLLMAVLGYAVQIWGDFSGYTDMGRGAARLLGIRLPENFLAPYLSQRPSEFWRRWHITLSQWIRDYIYIPLGGNRGSVPRAVGVLFFTMALSGLWHGANWTFIIWGLYHGALLVGERVFGDPSLDTERFSWRTYVKTAAMFGATCIGWLIFRCPSLACLVDAMRTFVLGSAVNAHAPFRANIYIGVVFCALIHLLGYFDFDRDEYVVFSPAAIAFISAKAQRSPVFLGCLCGLLLALVFAGTLFMRMSETSSPFIYFKF